jgi:hypothetical protein
MTMVAPSPLPGPRASQSGGDAGHARRTTGDADFAAALSETLGEGLEESGGDEVAANLRDVTRPPPRAMPRLEVRERRVMAAPDTADLGARVDVRAEPEIDGPLAGHPVGTRDAAAPIDPQDALLPEVPDATATDDEVVANVAPPPAPPRSDPVRDVLAVLGVNPAARHDSAVAATEPVMPSRRPALAPGAAMSAPRRSELASGEIGALGGQEPSGDVPDISTIPVRVLRQETHFQPVAHDARRLLGLPAGSTDDRVLPPTLAAVAKVSRPQALQRDAQDLPTGPDRAVEVKGAVAPPVLAADEAKFGTVGQQIADGVQRAMSTSAESAATRSVPGTDPAAAPTFAPAVRSIKLQLNPVSLGVVTIVLTAGDGDLRVHVEAERAETFGRVEQERSALSARLNGAGYAITELTVGRIGTADIQPRDGDQGGAAARQGGQTGGQHADTAGGGAREGAAQSADQRAGRHSGERAVRADTVAASAKRGGVGEQAVAGVSYSGRFRPV